MCAVSISTSDQDCKRQETDLIVFAEKNGYAVAGVWKETASGSKNDRQQRQQVLNLAQARKNRHYSGDRTDALGTINIGLVSYAQRPAILGCMSDRANGTAV